MESKEGTITTRYYKKDGVLTMWVQLDANGLQHRPFALEGTFRRKKGRTIMTGVRQYLTPPINGELNNLYDDIIDTLDFLSSVSGLTGEMITEVMEKKGYIHGEIQSSLQ